MAAFAGFIGVRLAGGFEGNTYRVTATFDRAGQLLKVTSDVKLRGILVGKVAKIELTDQGQAHMTFSMFANQRVPANVSAGVRGKTLFGEKFVQLTVDDPSDELLKSGDHIPPDRITNPFELETVLETGLPVLEAIEPDRLGDAFRALGEGVAGQEEEARRSIENGLIALRSLNSRSADLDRLFGGLDEGADAFARASPGLIAALGDLDTFNRTVLSKSFQASGALRDVPTWMDSVAQLMEARFTDLVDLSVKGADVLDTVSNRREKLPYIVESLKNFTQSWVTNMSVGCTLPDGTTVGQQFPSLEGSTCWQIWQLDATEGMMDSPKTPGGYDSITRPTPNAAVAYKAYQAQVTQLLRLPFGRTPDELTLFMYSPLRDSRGLIPESLL